MHRMSAQDAWFLHVESDSTPMHVGGVSLFEGPPPPFEDVLARIAGKLALVPRYRQVVRFVPFDVSRPVWVDDPHLNLGYGLVAERAAQPTPALDLGAGAAVRRSAGPPRAGRHRQRRGAGCDHGRLSRAARVPRRAGRSGTAHARAGVGQTARRAGHLQQPGVGDLRRASGGDRGPRAEAGVDPASRWPA